MHAIPTPGLQPDRPHLLRAGRFLPRILPSACLALPLAMALVSTTFAAPSGDGQLQWFADRAALLAHAGAMPLAEENWRRALVARGFLAECFQALGARSDDPCLTPGSVVEGFAVRTRLGGVFFNGTDVDLIMLGQDFLNLPATAVGNNVIGNGDSSPTVIDFDPPVTVVGLTLHDPMSGEAIDLRVFGAGDVELDTRQISLSAGSGFAGFASSAPVTRVEFNATLEGGELFSSLIFGGGSGRLAAVADTTDFGVQLRGAAAQTSLALTNQGWLDLHVPGLPALAQLAAPFAVTADTCSGATLAPGATCTIGLSFTPSHDGEFSQHIELAPFGSDSIELRGQARGPRLSTQPGHLSFGAVPVGSSSAAQQLTLSNRTGASIQQLPLNLPAQLARTGGSCSTAISLAPGESCTLSLVFNPTSQGEFDHDLAFVIGGQQAAQATVSGRGTGGAP